MSQMRDGRIFQFCMSSCQFPEKNSRPFLCSKSVSQSLGVARLLLLHSQIFA